MTELNCALTIFTAVVQLVSESNTPPIRPRVPDDDCDIRYLKLMHSCWDENPLQRPTFEAVKAKLRQIHGGRFVCLLAFVTLFASLHVMFKSITAKSISLQEGCISTVVAFMPSSQATFCASYF